MRHARWLPLLALLTAATPSPAQEPKGGAKVYRDAVGSTVWIHSARRSGPATGSGTLVDAERKLVLTNYHVVEDIPKATVYFPEFRDGRPVAERAFYTERANRLGIRGEVVGLAKSADLALVRLERLPAGVKAVSLAARSPEPGETVHSIGNAGKSGALWGYVSGTVRQVYRKKWAAALSRTRTLKFEARVIETDTPTNPGDSGGPLLNDAGQLVGVTQGGVTDASLVSYFIDVSEVRQLLAARGVTAAIEAKPVAPKDAAKLFDAAKLKDLEPALAELAKAGVVLAVETESSPPDALAGKVRRGVPAIRRKLYHEWAGQLLAKSAPNGALVLVTTDPRVVHVELSEAARRRYPADFSQLVSDTLVSALKDKKPDAGLADAVKLFADKRLPTPGASK